jgi:putative Holliday junction resolvase
MWFKTVFFSLMGKIIAIDYGTKRVGLAATDDLKIIASGLTTVHSQDVIAYLKDYIAKNEVETIVVGEPKNLDNTPSESAETINNFVKHLARTFTNIPIKRMDERFTSKMAFQTMIDSGLKKKAPTKKALVVEKSAVIMLHTYMEINGL